MMPNMPQAQPPMGGAPAPEGGQDIVPMLIQAAKRLNAIAKQNGIDLIAILQEDTGEEAGMQMPPGPPPM